MRFTDNSWFLAMAIEQLAFRLNSNQPLRFSWHYQMSSACVNEHESKDVACIFNIPRARAQFLISRKYWKEAIRSLSKYQSCAAEWLDAWRKMEGHEIHCSLSIGQVYRLMAGKWKSSNTLAALGLNFIMQAAARRKREREERGGRRKRMSA